MKKEILLVIILAVIIIALGGVLIWSSRPADNNQQNPPVVSIGIKIDTLKADDEVSSPLKITGSVNGNGWTGFEGQVGTVQLIDYKGNKLAEGFLAATSEWTTLPTNFETTLEFSSETNQPATLVFHNENASGLPEKNKEFTLPIKLTESKTIGVDIFFGNQALSSSGEQDECKRVYHVRRYIDKTPAVAEATISELLKGPSDAEKGQGYFSSVPEGSKLNSISIVNGEARVDFNKATESGGGSCSMASRVAQITQTLMQFPAVKSVRLSVDGRVGDIFQP